MLPYMARSSLHSGANLSVNTRKENITKPYKISFYKGPDLYTTRWGEEVLELEMDR